jgi:hypothetical protein
MLPIKTLNLVLKEIDRKEKADAYFHSISVARLAHIVVGALGGKDASQKVKFNDLMPFKPSDIFGKQDSDCTPRTRMIIKKLIKTGQMPMFLMPLLVDELDE